MTFLEKTILSLIVVTGFVLCFFGISERPIEKWDEETNIQVVQNLNNSIDLKFNESNFFEKPPLWYYSTFLVTKAFGHNLFSYRFLSAVSGFILLILILFYCIRYLNVQAAIFSGITFLTTFQFFYINPQGIFSTHNIRSADLDLLQILFNFVSLFLIIEFEKSKMKKFLIWSAVFCGLGILTKGFVSLLVPFAWMVWRLTRQLLYVRKLSKNHSSYSMIMSRSMESFRTLLLYFLTTFLISSPWHFYMYWKFGNEFIQKYFIYHNLERATRTIEQHFGYTYFHFNNLFNLNFFSSGIILFLGIIYLLISKKFLDIENCIILIFTILVLLTITIVETKLAWYLLYVFPTGIIICGIFYEYLFNLLKIWFHKLQFNVKT